MENIFFNLFYFENFDADKVNKQINPRIVLKESENLDIIQNICTNDIYSINNNSFNQSNINQLIDIGIIKIENNLLEMNQPFFLEKDLKVLKELVSNVANEIVSIIKKNINEIYTLINKISNGFDKKTNLYLILGGKIFDGVMFQFLEEKNLVTTSKINPNGLDYLVVLYQNQDKLNKFSKELICSYNRYGDDKGCFSSFGDSNGERKDFYRYHRLNDLKKLNEVQTEIINFSKESLIEMFCELIKGNDIPEAYTKVFDYFSYTKDGKICVPFFTDKDDQVTNDLYDLMVKNCSKTLENALFNIQSSSLTCLQHHIDIKDIANEIYHLIFGTVNQMLIDKNIFAKPYENTLEGKYIKSFELYAYDK